MRSSLWSRTQCEGGLGSFDEDVLRGTEDAHVFSVVLLERRPVVGQRTEFSQVPQNYNLHVPWTLMGTACPVLPVPGCHMTMNTPAVQVCR